jgi:RimJ/RimL family protein N-acetyltransferase
MSEERPRRTQRLLLRPWSAEDLDYHFDIYHRWEVMRWLGADPKPLSSPEESLAGITRWLERCQWPYGLWAVVPDEVGHPVGSALLVHLQDAEGHSCPDVEVGWHFHPDHWGHGYATESAACLLEAAWREGLDEVWAVIHAGNSASVAVTERLGMTPQGTTDRWYGVELESYRIAAPGSTIT